MIAAVLCLLFPAAGGCTQYVDFVPSVQEVVRDERFYDGKALRITGQVASLNRWRSRAGTYFDQAFFICRQGDCVHVFIESSLPLRSGETVSVRGRYYREYRSGRTLSRNEIEATEVLPAE